MRLGMFMMPVHPPDRAFWSTLEEDTEKSILAETLGFDEVWLGEHFSATTEPIPSPMMFISTSAISRNARLVPLHHVRLRLLGRPPMSIDAPARGAASPTRNSAGAATMACHPREQCSTL